MTSTNSSKCCHLLIGIKSFVYNHSSQNNTWSKILYFMANFSGCSILLNILNILLITNSFMYKNYLQNKKTNFIELILLAQRNEYLPYLLKYYTYGNIKHFISLNDIFLLHVRLGKLQRNVSMCWHRLTAIFTLFDIWYYFIYFFFGYLKAQIYDKYRNNFKDFYNMHILTKLI